LWVIIDTLVYDLSKFAKLHPGGLSVLLDEDVGERLAKCPRMQLTLMLAGKDATTVFFSLHRMEVLMRPQFQRLAIGRIDGESPKIRKPEGRGELSRVPYAEPSWLNPSFDVPYYNESHFTLREEMRKIVDKIKPEAQEREVNGKYPSPEIHKLLGDSKISLMRLGPGKHLHGHTLLGGIKGEDFDYFQ
jgi:hypothetical protein